MPQSSAALSPKLLPTTAAATPNFTETSMEKNPNSNASNKVPPRSSSTGPTPGESKPKTDGKNNGGSKRYNRKREPSFPKPDSFPGSRRSNPQKSKTFDKRPPQRGGGQQYGVTGGGRREEVAEARRAEFSPAQFAGPKKISLNHLLNFTFEPRGGYGGVGDGGHSCWGRRNKWGHKHKPFNKEQFLQANCQFIVSDDQDYKVHLADPDRLVNWDYVQQVRIYSHEVPSCPICLYPPLTARITRCGHIFCWPCMLHYISLSDKSWSKCPICYESVHLADLKSVVAMETRQYAVGDVITMHLMRREKGSLVALPSSQWVKVEEPVYFGDSSLGPNSKLLLASAAQVLSLVLEEKAALQAQLLQEDDAQECFIQRALSLAVHRRRSLVQHVTVSTTRFFFKIVQCTPGLTQWTSVLSSPQHVPQYSSAFDDKLMDLPEEFPDLPEDLPEDLPGVQEECVEAPTDEAPQSQAEEVQTQPGRPSAVVGQGPYYYFYQADDCQQMFLNPLNVRCLMRQYGSLEASPDSITGTVVEVVGQTVTEEVRRRNRYLAHLPLTCEFSICELALQPPVVSKETLETFADELEKRKRLRQKKARDEKRREKRIEMEENKKQGKSPPLVKKFVWTHPSSYEPLKTGANLICSLSPDGLMFPSLNGQSPSPVFGSVEDDSHCMSFAQVCTSKKLLAPPAADSDGESDGSERVPVPSFQNSFSQAFEKALMQLDMTGSSFSDDKGGKRKKKKQKLLFSTSMVHTK
uniref:E3 ubiquitin-protein ligase RNF10 n=1 Tax=Cynoglossus semilaevis TaxID=244447 RepID=A0A3P8VSQ6_CYNSE